MHGKRKVNLRESVLAGIVLLALVLRLYRLGAESLWYDETVSVHLAGKSLPALIEHTAGDIHPPGYYVLLHGWTRLAGDSDFAVALPSLFFGVLLLILAYWLGAKVFGVKAGLAAALLVAISPYNIWYSQEVRMYTLGAVLGMGALVAVLQLLPVPGFTWKRRLPWLVVYVICGALGLWSLYYFAFLLVALNLMVAAWWFVTWRRGRAGPSWLWGWLLIQVVVLLLYAPWIAVAWRQATQPPVPPWRDFTGLATVLVETWSALSLGQSVAPVDAWPMLVLFLALCAAGLLLQPDPGEKAGVGSARWLLIGYVTLPLLLIYLASFITPLYHVRYAFTFSTPFYVVVGAGVAWLLDRWRLVGWFMFVVVTVSSGVSLHAYHTDARFASDDHRAAVQFLMDEWRPGDAILVNAGYAYTALVTYWEGEPIACRGRLVGDSEGEKGESGRDAPVVVQAGSVDGAPSLGWGDPDSDFYAMSRAETADALGRLFAHFDRVWVYRIYDTVTDPDGFIRLWLEEHGTPFYDQVFTGEAGLRVQGFLTTRDPLSGVNVPLYEQLADGSLQLLASTPLPLEVPVGGDLDLALVWQVGSPPAEDATFFAGLFDETGQRWAQTDEHPMGPLYLARNWQVGSKVRMPFRIQVPPGTPPGIYSLAVGWYRFEDGWPVWVPWQSAELLQLGQVEVVAPADWEALARPSSTYSAGVEIGEGVRLLGFDVESFDTQPGGVVRLDIVWLALTDSPTDAPAVFRLEDDTGQLLAEVAAAPVGGRVPFSSLKAGQTLRDRVTLALPENMAYGVYDLSVSRRGDNGSWLTVRRGLLPLGSYYPLATIRVFE